MNCRIKYVWVEKKTYWKQQGSVWKKWLDEASSEEETSFDEDFDETGYLDVGVDEDEVNPSDHETESEEKVSEQEEEQPSEVHPTN